MNDLKIENNKPIPWDQIEAIFFDLDGTLMDTDDELVEKIANKLKILGANRAQRFARWFVMFIETPLNATITFIDLLGLDQLLFHLLGKLKKTKSHFPIMEGTLELVPILSKNYKLAVVSSRPERSAHLFLKQYGLEGFFQVVVGNNTTKRMKPHPEPIIYTANRLGVPLEKCLMVGDTTTDIVAARKAGAYSVGLLCGFGEIKELEDCGATIIVSTIAELGKVYKENTI